MLSSAGRGQGILIGQMRKTKPFKWIILGISAACLLIVALWIGVIRERQETPEIGERGEEELEVIFRRKNTEAMGISQLKAYIEACEEARDFEAGEQAYQRAIELTQGKKSLFMEFMDFKFGLADLYLNSLWEYGQFGEGVEMPPGLRLAIRIYDEIIASYPGSELAAEAQFRKGRVFHNELSGYWNTLHREDAIREFQKVIDVYPGTDQAKRAEQKLATLEREKYGR